MTDKPTLIVRTIDVPHGKAVALCTEDGEAFGMQLACAVSSEADDYTRVTVTFVVDGEAIRLDA